MYISQIKYNYTQLKNNITVKNETQKEANNGYLNLNAQPKAVYFHMSFTGHQANKHKLSNYKGCLLGGAIGDALGYPVEFMELRKINKLYGKEGIKTLKNGENGQAQISDDTQMTLFTADGLLKSIGENFRSSRLPDINIIHDSYKNWLETQNGVYDRNSNKGWIFSLVGLYERRNPGNTCINSLKSNEIGTIKKPINNSKGNGGVMRVAPAGLLYYNSPKMAFNTGVACAAITHGHPSGYLAAGVFSSMLAYLVKGETIENAVDKSINILEKYDGHEEVKDSIILAKNLAKSNVVSPKEAINKIGGGWVAEEAIAISIYCALKFPDSFENAVKAAVNHDGDSDSTGAITGNIMGLYLGEESIPKNWRDKIELKNEIRQLASDLFIAPKNIQRIKERYPYNNGRIPNWYDSGNKGPAVKLNQVKFLPQDIERMKKMTPEEKIRYKKYLMKKQKYIM